MAEKKEVESVISGAHEEGGYDVVLLLKDIDRAMWAIVAAITEIPVGNVPRFAVNEDGAVVVVEAKSNNSGEPTRSSYTAASS